MKEDQKNSTSSRFPTLRIAAMLVFACIVVGAIAAYRYDAHRSVAFVQHWKERFRTVDSLDKAMQIMGPEPVFVRKLSSGEWFIATCEHACCSGAGFDATVIRDSTGAIYVDTTHTFCGIEGMSSELEEVSADSLSAFYSHLTQLKLQKQ